MDVLQSHDLIALAKGPKNNNCVTVCLNLGVSPETRSLARPRLRFLCKRVNRALEFTMDKAQIETFMRPFIDTSREVIRNPPPDARGAVFFRSEDKLGVYFVKHEIEDHCAVSDSFHLKPLLNTMQGLGTYQVIVLNRHQIRFYEGNHARVTPLGSVQRFGPRGDAAASFELESLSDIPDEGLDAFLPRAAEAFKALVKDSDLPVVLVGSSWLRLEFRRIGQLRNLVDEVVAANLIFAHEALIHSHTWPIAAREFDRRKGSLLSQVRKGRDATLACDDIATIAPASMMGRISRILVSQEDTIFGRLNRSQGCAELYSPEKCPFGDDILCDIAQEVLHHGGTAILLPRKEMPMDAPAVAAFRW